MYEQAMELILVISLMCLALNVPEWALRGLRALIASSIDSALIAAQRITRQYTDQSSTIESRAQNGYDNNARKSEGGRYAARKMRG